MLAALKEEETRISYSWMHRIRRSVRSMSTEPQRTCSICGNEFSGAMEFCPVCMLRKALAGGTESGESSASEDTVKPTTPEQAVQRFEHYELVTGEDGERDSSLPKIPTILGIWILILSFVNTW